jgi:predicted HD phosphohydrolase
MAEHSPVRTAMAQWAPEQLDRWASTIQSRGKASEAHSMSEVLVLLEKSAEIEDGSGVDQKEHCLQTATRAFRDGADEEIVVAALCHDIGKVFSAVNHSAIAAEILRPHVSRDVYEMVRNHMLFESRFYGGVLQISGPDQSRVPPTYLCTDPEAHKALANESWYRLAMRFTGDWDQQSFDPDYDTLPVAHFQPLLARVFDRRFYSVKFTSAAQP